MCTIYGIYWHMCNRVTYPILRHMLSYTNNRQLHHHSYLMALGVQLHWFEYLGTNIIRNVMRCMPMLHNGLQVERLYKNETCDQIWHLTNYKQNKVYILYWSFCNKLDELEALKWDKIIVLHHSLSLSIYIYFTWLWPKHAFLYN